MNAMELKEREHWETVVVDDEPAWSAAKARLWPFAPALRSAFWPS
jgi:hypothetical protein